MFSSSFDFVNVVFINQFQFDNRRWDTGGSKVLTKTLREYCNIPLNDEEQITG